jgi:hypothetical protein
MRSSSFLSYIPTLAASAVHVGHTATSDMHDLDETMSFEKQDLFNEEMNTKIYTLILSRTSAIR